MPTVSLFQGSGSSKWSWSYTPSLKKNLTNWILFSLSQRNETYEEIIEFYVSLCGDVLFEVLKFGDRRPITKLERVGRRFYYLIERCFSVTPFLRLDLKLEPEFVFIIFFFQHKQMFTILIIITIGVHVTSPFWNVLPDAFDNSFHFLVEMQELSASEFSLFSFILLYPEWV